MNRTTSEVNKFERIISDNIKFIEKQCFLIIRKGFIGKSKAYELSKLEMENRSVELFNSVVDLLKKDDFKILKSFGGRAKITTYLSTVISRRFVDIVRKKYGRKREKARAKEFGKLGLDIYNQIIINGLCIDEFCKNNNSIGIEVASDIVDRIRGLKKYDKKDIDNFPETPVKKGIETDNNEIIVSDKGKLPEILMLEEEKSLRIKDYINIILKNLTEEEKFILKVKFYNEGEDKGKITKNIAVLLNIEQRKVYNLIDKTLKKCKKILEKEGLNAEDLF